MSHGTMLNSVYAIRIHRTNARETVEQADSCIAHCRDELLVMAASSPRDMNDGEDWAHYVMREVSENVELIQEQAVSRFMAQYIIDCPEEVQDDYDEFTSPDPDQINEKEKGNSETDER